MIQVLGVACDGTTGRVGQARNPRSRSDVFQLGFIHPEVVSQFMEHRLSDFVTDFAFIGADRLDVFLVQDNAVRTDRQVEHTSPRGRHTLKHSQNHVSSLVRPSVPCGHTRLSPKTPWRLVLNENREVVHPFAKFFGKCIEDFRDQPNESFPFHLGTPHC